MYRTAVVTAYDVMDRVHVKATITEYDDSTHQGSRPTVYEVNSTVVSHRLADPHLWLWEAIQALQMMLDNQ